MTITANLYRRRILHAGSLNQRIHIQQRSGSGNLGHPGHDWENITPKPIAANIRYSTGSEAVQAGQLASHANVRILIRWRSDVTAQMRVNCVSTGVAYEILAVLPDLTRKESVNLLCKVLT